MRIRNNKSEKGKPREIIPDISRGKAGKTERRLITAALPYINNVPHLGHIVGSHLPADIFARYCRLRGYETLFVGGTDENGSTSEIAAEEIGVNIDTFSNKLNKEHKRIYDWFNISYDNFSRTSNPLHHRTTQEFFKKIYKNGFVIKGKMKVFYSPEEKRYLPDRHTKGTCAKCGYKDANADQCEKCAAVLDVTQLLHPRSALSGKPVEVREVQHLFFRLDKLSEKLKNWLKEKTYWRSQVTSIAFGWMREGLKKRCITRDLKHGIKVPLEGFRNKVFYVWFDALIDYISATKEADPENWEKFWKEKNTKIYHFLGKDNIPFHTIFWPAMLMAHGEFNLPYYVVGLQYLNYEGEKFSKSKKIGIFCENLPKTGLDSDILRAYLTFIIPELRDTEFKLEDFQNRINSEIVGNYGNFIHRTLSFIYDKLGKKIKRPSETELTESDRKLLETIRKKIKKIEGYFEKVHLRSAFLEILSLSSDGNKYFNDNEPWNTIKKDFIRTNHILYLCANLCRTLAILIQVYLPDTSRRIWEQLNLKGEVEEKGIWNTVAGLNLPAHHIINKPHILFNKLDDKNMRRFKKIVSGTKPLKEFFYSN